MLCRLARMYECRRSPLGVLTPVRATVANPTQRAGLVSTNTPQVEWPSWVSEINLLLGQLQSLRLELMDVRVTAREKGMLVGGCAHCESRRMPLQNEKLGIWFRVRRVWWGSIQRRRRLPLQRRGS